MRRHPRQHCAEDGGLERLYDCFLVTGWGRVHSDVGFVRSPLQDGAQLPAVRCPVAHVVDGDLEKLVHCQCGREVSGVSGVVDLDESALRAANLPLFQLEWQHREWEIGSASGAVGERVTWR